MSKWSPEELAVLRTTADYHAFGEATNYSKSYDAWEVKRRRVVKSPGEMSPILIQRALVNNIKLARQVIRLRHSIEADDELAHAIPRIKEILQSQAQEGHVNGISYDELRTLIYGS
jgi:hypothetical protein